MKYITFIRHAKSSWDEYDLSDFERPLKKRGKNDTKLMVENVISKIDQPDGIFISNAIRAFETFDLINKDMNYPESITFRRDYLYTFDWHELLTIIRSFDDTLNDVFVIAHNPALTEVINYLSMNKKLLNLQTAGVCRLKLDTDSWKNISKDCGEVLLYHFPKEYRVL